MGEKPDVVIGLIKTDKSENCQVCDFIEQSVEKRGEKEDVLFIVATVSSEFEKKINKVRDGNPILVVSKLGD